MQIFIFLNFYVTQPNPFQPEAYMPNQNSLYQTSKY